MQNKLKTSQKMLQLLNVTFQKLRLTHTRVRNLPKLRLNRICSTLGEREKLQYILNHIYKLLTDNCVLQWSNSSISRRLTFPKLPNSGSSHDSAPGQYMGDYSQKNPAKLTSLEWVPFNTIQWVINKLDSLTRWIPTC